MFDTEQCGMESAVYTASISIGEMIDKIFLIIIYGIGDRGPASRYVN